MISKNQIKFIRSLHNKKNRENEKLFIVEGIKTVNELIHERPELIKELYCTSDYHLKNVSKLQQNAFTTTLVKESDLLQISQLSTPNEVLAVCYTLINDKITTDLNSTFSFYLDDIRDPGNLGTIIRICSWFGIKELFCSPDTVELYNPKCIQSTMGAFLRVRLHYMKLDELLKKKQINTVFATVLNGESIYSKPLLNGLIIIGNEANGISAASLQLANRQITIPSGNKNTESLNAAVATSIIASEFFRNTVKTT